MLAVKACNILITGANRGLGLEIVKQLSEDSCQKRQIYATCRDPDGPKSEALRELAKKHPSVITIIRLGKCACVLLGAFEIFTLNCHQIERILWDIKIDQMKISHETGSEANIGFGCALMPSYLGMHPPKAAFFSFQMQSRKFQADADNPCSVKESAKKVGSLVGKNGLNLLVNNAAIVANGTIQTSSVEDMKNTSNTNVIGPLLIIREYLPYLQTAAEVSRTPGMSCNKAAVINISTLGGSLSRMPSMYEQFPVLPYCVSKAALNMLSVLAAEELKADEILCMALHPGWVKTEMGGEKAPLEPKESVEGMLRVIGSLTEKQHSGFMDWNGETVPW